MDRRIVVGATLTTFAVVASVFLGRIDAIIAAGFVGGLAAGVLSRPGSRNGDGTGHVGAGAKAAGIGGAAGFVLFVVVGTIQSLFGGDLSVPAVLGLLTILLAAVVVPIQALLGAIGGAVGVRIRLATIGRSR